MISSLPNGLVSIYRVPLGMIAERVYQHSSTDSICQSAPVKQPLGIVRKAARPMHGRLVDEAKRR